MKALLYLFDELRSKFKEPYQLYIDTYTTRIAPIFENIEDEANEVAEKHFNEAGANYDPDYHDPSDYAESAWEKGLEHYEGLALMQYNTQLMWITTMYQFWEQQVRKFLFQEISRTHTMYDKKGKEVKFKDFCVRGIDDIKSEFLDFNFDLENLSKWSDMNELRLLANVIKHGEGWSATQLEKINPRLFKSPTTNSNLMELYKTTLNDIALNVDESDFLRYANSLINFWDELPERLHSK